ncbi:MAG: hypothetical protein COA47_18175 [Robiginitomaculum sp.]|nr:MAG: hypothetical protein COA47_18175 [Robiginitomaculum sp.]
MKQALSLIALIVAVPAFAEEQRQLDAHEHGVGTLNIAIDGATVAMEFHAPGADIVGFEYAAESEADKAAIDAAVAILSAPLDLFGLSGAAACTLTEAHAELENEDTHDEDGHDEDGHDDHAAGEHDDDEEDHGDEEHDEGAGHTEFHANYTLTCDNPAALTEITFPYFDTFPNALEVEVQIITATGAQAFEVERDAPILDLGR